MPKKLTITHTTAEGPWKREWIIADKGEEYAEKKYRELAYQLRIIYRQAADDLFAKQMDFAERHQKRVERYRREVEAGLLTEQDFQAWMRGQIFQQKAWELKRGQLARLMADIDQQAMRLVNREALDVFAENANWMHYKIEQDTGMVAAFGLFNGEAVARLIRDNPNLLPVRDIDPEKDYQWYNRIMQNAVIHGILQGETLDEIALRVSEETGEKALDTLRRHTRTAFTGAMNAGGLMAMERARDEYGIVVQKRWMATLDDRTRHAHQALDGQVQDIDDPFDSPLGEIMFPGDPNAEPANVWNCRCWMDEFYPEHDNKRARYDVDGNFVGDVSYEEWLEMQMEGD